MNDDERQQMLDQTEIDLEVHALRIREAAKEQVRRIRAGAVTLPLLLRLDEFLAVPTRT